MSVSQAVRDPRGYVVRTAGMYRALLFDPDYFYDEYLSERGIVVEIFLVLAVGLVGTAGHYYAMTRVTTAFSEADFPINNDVNFALYQLTLEPLIGVTLLWVGSAVLLFAISWLYSTVGQFYTVLKRTAWALVPLVVANLLNTVAIAYAAFQLTEDDVAGASVPRPPEQFATFMWDQVAGEVYVVATVFVAVVFVVWAGYIAAFAVRDPRDLTTSEALRVAALPTLAYAVYVVYQGIQVLTYQNPVA